MNPLTHRSWFWKHIMHLKNRIKCTDLHFQAPVVILLQFSRFHCVTFSSRCTSHVSKHQYLFWSDKSQRISHLWKAEKRLLGESMRGPWGRSVPLSFTQCRYPRVMSAMPMARAEQYRNLYPFLQQSDVCWLSCFSLTFPDVIMDANDRSYSCTEL